MRCAFHSFRVLIVAIILRPWDLRIKYQGRKYNCTYFYPTIGIIIVFFFLFLVYLFLLFYVCLLWGIYVYEVMSEAVNNKLLELLSYGKWIQVKPEMHLLHEYLNLSGFTIVPCIDVLTQSVMQNYRIIISLPCVNLQYWWKVLAVCHWVCDFTCGLRQQSGRLCLNCEAPKPIIRIRKFSRCNINNRVWSVWKL